MYYCVEAELGQLASIYWIRHSQENNWHSLLLLCIVVVFFFRTMHSVIWMGLRALFVSMCPFLFRLFEGEVVAAAILKVSHLPIFETFNYVFPWIVGSAVRPSEAVAPSGERYVFLYTLIFHYRMYSCMSNSRHNVLSAGFHSRGLHIFKSCTTDVI